MIASTCSFDYDNQKCVPVVASFDADGHVVPLYVRIAGYPYKVLSHWIPPTHFSSTIISYNCKVDANGYERPLFLRYYTREHVWTIPGDTG